MQKFVLDTNCFIGASKTDRDAADFEEFVQMAAPGLYLSAVVAAELRAGVVGAYDAKQLERAVFKPYSKRGRVAVPSVASWEALGRALAWFVENEGLDLRRTPRSFIFDILIAHSCRELGAVLVSGNERDLKRIRQVFQFEFSLPYPAPR